MSSQKLMLHFFAPAIKLVSISLLYVLLLCVLLYLKEQL